MRISDWSSDVCSSDLTDDVLHLLRQAGELVQDREQRLDNGHNQGIFAANSRTRPAKAARPGVRSLRPASRKTTRCQRRCRSDPDFVVPSTTENAVPSSTNTRPPNSFLAAIPDAWGRSASPPFHPPQKEQP